MIASDRPRIVERLIVHQFDPAHPTPGGIDTCLRGLAAYVPEGIDLAFVGVDAGSDSKRKLGHWEQHRIGDRTIWFMPVTRLDPADQSRRIPHSLRLMSAVLRYRRRLPHTRIVQAHRADTAWVARLLVRSPLAYFIHTQEGGLTGTTSDSFWRGAGGIHQRMERSVSRRAFDVVVFNEPYTAVVRRWNPAARFSPTWFDPANVRPHTPVAGRIVWVGRLETPKDPLLAIDVIEVLATEFSGEPWSLDVVGSGTLEGQLTQRVSDLVDSIRARVRLHGRLPPADVARLMATASVFLMTSHEGYEGYPRVLVEALASGAPAIVTNGSDTGGLVTELSGAVGNRDPRVLAELVRRAVALDSAVIVESVAHLAAERIVSTLLSSSPEAQ